ncbi:tRNA-dihydrouridine synthase [Demequina litorisediminis]|uniref:Diguanylate cyclase n=1 Tax=Demequina litorisediminis TaxID=1849022 RepID=A0ABQ6IFR7_9MICO|nr:tRNA-dihydrouridine synthase [Demequina litorisediminis]GMA36135.1 diguanylate cyclase [Demequina litorisediminis]
MGQPVHRPFGIPAGPLVNASFCAAAFTQYFDIAVYKTVRTAAHASHPFPNCLAVRVNGPLDPDRLDTLCADADVDTARSITNSFGVPSRDPDAWQRDMAAAVRAAAPGQVLVGSFQGTRTGTGEDAYVADHVRAATLCVEAGAPVLEMNLSCPNEGTGNLLCFDTALVARIAAAVKEAVGDVPLLLKVAHFRTDEALTEFLAATATIVDGYAAINTVPARLVDASGAPALPGAGREVGGVCGEAILPAALGMVRRIARWRAGAGADVALVGVGGVMNVEDVAAHVAAGADAVMSATGAMIDPQARPACRVRVVASLTPDTPRTGTKGPELRHRQI